MRPELFLLLLPAAALTVAAAFYVARKEQR